MNNYETMKKEELVNAAVEQKLYPNKTAARKIGVEDLRATLVAFRESRVVHFDEDTAKEPKPTAHVAPKEEQGPTIADVAKAARAARSKTPPDKRTVRANQKRRRANSKARHAKRLSAHARGR